MFCITNFQRFLLFQKDTTTTTKKILLLRLDVLFPNQFSNSIGFYADMKMIFRCLFTFNLFLTVQTNWLHCKLYSYVQVYLGLLQSLELRFSELWLTTSSRWLLSKKCPLKTTVALKIGILHRYLCASLGLDIYLRKFCITCFLNDSILFDTETRLVWF